MDHVALAIEAPCDDVLALNEALEKLESKHKLKLLYRSTRPLAPLAEGLIRGCAEHFGETVELETEDRSHGEGTCALFHLRRTEPAQ